MNIYERHHGAPAESSAQALAFVQGVVSKVKEAEAHAVADEATQATEELAPDMAANGDGADAASQAKRRTTVPPPHAAMSEASKLSTDQPVRTEKALTARPSSFAAASEAKPVGEGPRVPARRSRSRPAPRPPGSGR